MEKKLRLSWFTRCRLNWVGANEDILRKCPTEIPKYAGFGTTILVTAVLASISGGYAIYAISRNPYIPFLFGPLWGFVIFNLDCAIITNMQKPKIPKKDETILWEEKDINEERKKIKLRALRKELRSKQNSLFFVRFVVAVIIGFIVSMPLEALIFSKRIHKKWDNDNKIKNERESDSLLQSIDDILAKRENILKSARQEDSALYKDSRLIILESKNKEILELISENKKDKGEQQRIYEANLIRVIDSLGNVVYVRNSRAKEALRRISNLNKQILDYESLIQKNNRESADIIAKLALESERIKSNQENNYLKLDSIVNQAERTSKEDKKKLQEYDQPDLIEQIEILSDLRGNRSVMWTSILITLLFIIIEVAPVSVKFLTQRGVYDELLEIAEKARITEETYTFNRKFAAISSALKAEIGKAQKREATEVDIYSNAMDELAANRLKIIKEMIKKSEQEQIDKIHNDNNNTLNPEL